MSRWLSQGFSPSCEVPAAQEMLQDFLVRGRLGEGAEGQWIFLSVSSFTTSANAFPSGRAVQNIPAQAALKEKVPRKQISVWAF